MRFVSRLCATCLLDPSFALAYARLSHVETIFNSEHKADPSRREKARAAAQEALRLQPDLSASSQFFRDCTNSVTLAAFSLKGNARR